MATYIPGVTDYIPNFQPFQPDYNFLGNMLQNAQSKYDANYKTLNKTYGTLLNSPMLREDNIQQRDEFFKMIDGDIKRISGMDLSLQQNVDSANTVFDSFYQNKNMVKDMVYTKEYQNQLSVGENYRNCIDQEKCGGKYSDEAMNALHYKADEFKKASREETLSMSPGRFTPFINIQEKAMKYAKDLLGKNGAFGITSVGLDKTGRYIVTTKNGSQLEIPLEQLISNQYGQDQAIQDMFNTKAYVNRKSYVQQNAERFGGNENAAEDEYFQSADAEVQKIKTKYDRIVKLATGSQAKKDILEEQVKTTGSTGEDDLANDFLASGIDAVSSQVALAHHEDNVKIADSIFEAGDNRQMKRQRIDGMYARSLMGKQFSDAAGTIAAMTGEQSMIADPYAKSYYDFSLDMTKLQTQYDLMDRNEMKKNIYELSKLQVLEEVKKRGSAISPENTPVWMPNKLGTTTGEIDEKAELTTDILENSAGTANAAQGFVEGYTNLLMSTVNSKDASAAEKANARWTLDKIYGVAAKIADGTYGGRSGYDSKTNTFIDKNGDSHNNPGDVSGDYDWRNLYEKAQLEGKGNRSIQSHKTFLDGKGKEYQEQYNTSEKLLEISSKLWHENNLNVYKFATLDPAAQADLKDPDDKLAWDTRFLKDGQMKTSEKFAEDYANAYADAHKADIGTHVGKTGQGPKDYTQTVYTVTKEDLLAVGRHKAAEKFAKTEVVYNTLYNQGDSKGGNVPLVKPLHGSSDVGGFGGGKTSGANVYAFSNNPASTGTRGLVTFWNDAQAGAVYTLDNQVDFKTATENQIADIGKTLFDTLINDVKNGKITGEEAQKMGLNGNVDYMDTALSNKDYVGIHIHPSQKWLDQYKGKGTGDNKEMTWADTEGLETKGVAVYIPKANAKNDFTQSYKHQPYDIILDHKDQTLTLPNAGSVTIMKRTPDGKLNVQGKVFAYSTDAQGKVVKVPVDVSQQYPKDTGGQNAYVAMSKWMQMINANNEEYLKSGKLVYSVSELDKVKKILNQGAGDAPDPSQDMASRFLEQVQFNMQQPQ